MSGCKPRKGMKSYHVTQSLQASLAELGCDFGKFKLGHVFRNLKRHEVQAKAPGEQGWVWIDRVTNEATEELPRFVLDKLAAGDVCGLLLRSDQCQSNILAERALQDAPPRTWHLGRLRL